MPPYILRFKLFRIAIKTCLKGLKHWDFSNNPEEPVSRIAIKTCLKRIETLGFLE